MRKPTLVILLRLALLVALAASAALFVDYQHTGDPAFCGVGSGCMAVRRSAFSSLGPIPLPTLGLAAYASLFAFSLLARSRLHHQIVAAFAAVGAVGACILLVVQFLVIGTFCPWCVAVDTSAIFAAVAATLLCSSAKNDEDENTAGKLARNGTILAVWCAAAGFAIGAPFVWGMYPVIPPLPPSIAALQVPGKLTIVSFTDFQCPFCRLLHPVLHDIAQEHGDRIAIVRKMKPLASHRGAMPAAIAYACTPEPRLGAMVDALYDASPHDLTRDGTVAIAATLGLDREAFSRCADGPEARATIESDGALFKEANGAGLPFTYVGRRVFMAYNPDGVRAATALGLAGEQPSLPKTWMFALLGLTFTVAALVTARTAQANALRQAPDSL